MWVSQPWLPGPLFKVLRIQTLFRELAETVVKTVLKQKDRHKEEFPEEAQAFGLCIPQLLGQIIPLTKTVRTWYGFQESSWTSSHATYWAKQPESPRQTQKTTLWKTKCNNSIHWSLRRKRIVAGFNCRFHWIIADASHQTWLSGFCIGQPFSGKSGLYSENYSKSNLCNWIRYWVMINHLKTQAKILT